MAATAPKHILLVEDNPGDVFLFQQCLVDTPGFLLHTCQNLAQARAFLQRRAPFADAPRPDIVFLDLGLPIHPGHEFIRFIKQDGGSPAIQVVVFTSSNSHRDMKVCRGYGADEYLIKPMDWPEWKPVIAKALARHVPGSTIDTVTIEADTSIGARSDVRP